MSKYIDSEKLIAEIESRLQENADKALVFGSAFAGRSAEDNDIKNLITSLQQEQSEVDLLKALDDYYNKADFGPSEAIEYEIHKDIASHFYELGLNARKED